MRNVALTRAGTKQLGAAGGETKANGVAVDAGGNVYVPGYTTGALDGNNKTGSSDLFVAKYDPAGNKQFTRQLGVFKKYTIAHGVAVDAGGNVYVAGYTTGGLDGNEKTGAFDLFVVKYDPALNKQFTNQLGVSGKTIAYGAAVDANGNVYVTGYTTGGLDGNAPMGYYDFFVIKYDPAGTKQFTRQLGVAGGETKARGIAVDAGGNVYAAGFTNSGLDGNTLMGSYDFFVAKYNSWGTKQ